MKYQNIMLTIISVCLIVITLFISGIIKKDVSIDNKGTYDVRITGIGIGPNAPLMERSLPVTVDN